MTVLHLCFLQTCLLTAGMEQVLKAQRDLLSLVQQCVSGPPIRRPTFGAVRRRLRDVQKQAARAGLATITPRG